MNNSPTSSSQTQTRRHELKFIDDGYVMQPLKRIAGVGLLASLCLTFVFGCESRAIQAGGEGHVQFYYSPADDSRDFSRSLAEGMGMMIHIEGLDGKVIE